MNSFEEIFRWLDNSDTITSQTHSTFQTIYLLNPAAIPLPGATPRKPLIADDSDDDDDPDVAATLSYWYPPPSTPSPPPSAWRYVPNGADTSRGRPELLTTHWNGAALPYAWADLTAGPLFVESKLLGGGGVNDAALPTLDDVHNDEAEPETQVHVQVCPKSSLLFRA
jgi:hypothetical protein